VEGPGRNRKGGRGGRGRDNGKGGGRGNGAPWRARGAGDAQAFVAVDQDDSKHDNAEGSRATTIERLIRDNYTLAEATDFVERYLGKPLPCPYTYAHPNFVLHTHAHEGEGDGFICDCGANRHVCNERALFVPYTLKPVRVKVMMGNSDTVTARAAGDVELISTLPDGKTRTVRLKNVLYVPECPKNLVSEVLLVKRGCRSGKEASGMTITDPQGRPLMVGTLMCLERWCPQKCFWVVLSGGRRR